MINISTASRLFVVCVGGTIAFTITGVNSAQAATFSSVNIFGDSLSDPGNLFKVSKGFIPQEPYYEGRFSNGEIWTDYLADDLELNPTPYTSGIASSEGVNYAFGGSTSGNTNIINTLYPSFPGKLPGVKDQVGAFIQPLLQQGKTADPNGLYMIWAGGNDYTYGGISDPTEVVNNLSWAVKALYSVGARNFLIANLPDLSQTPLGSSGDLVPPDELQDTVQEHNVLLRKRLNALDQTLSDSNVELFNVNAVFNDVIKKPAKYGFTNVTDQCLIGVVPCSNPDEYLFWDDFHPTTEGHKLIANAAYATIEKKFNSVPEPSTVLALTGLGLGLLLLKKNKIPTS
jgi:phospholipase/lecithinase/hemolysin